MCDSIDLSKSAGVEIDIQLLPTRLLRYAAATTIIYGAFAVTFYKGIPVNMVPEVIGTSARSEALAETYNTYSGYVMALVEVLVSMYVDKILAVIDVYVHNVLFDLERDPMSGQLRPKPSRYLRAVLLFLFPILLSLTMGNGLRSLQAVQTNAGFQHTMLASDLKKEQPAIERIKAKQAKANLAYQSAKQSNAYAMTQDERIVSGNILKNAVRQQATPFKFDTNSPCGQKGLKNGNATVKVEGRELTLDAREAAASSVAYGFIPREWNSEALSTKPTVISSYKIKLSDTYRENAPEPTDFSIQTAYEMLVQAKMVIERAYGNSVTGTYDCSDSDGKPRPTASATPTPEPPEPSESPELPSQSGSLPTDPDPFPFGFPFPPDPPQPPSLPTERSSSSSGPFDADETRRLEGFEDDDQNGWTYDDHGNRKCEGGVSSLFHMHDFYSKANATVEQLLFDTDDAMSRTVSNVLRGETTITLEKAILTSQIQIETMQIELTIGFPGGVHIFANLTSFCGSNGCAFLDDTQSFPVQPEIGVMPYVTNCSLDQIRYRADLRAFMPDNCTPVSNNTAFLYGYGSYVYGEEYGSNFSGAGYPYITNPRRRIRLTVAKVAWKTEDLAAAFDATCGEDSKKPLDCTGLWHKLQPSGRFLFAGENALASNRLTKADFRAPISLVQLTSPKVYYTNVGLVSLERLVPRKSGRSVWHNNRVNGGSALDGDKCSMLIDSYLNHINENNYFIESPMQAMYTSFFFFLMQNGAVTQLNDTSAALKGINTTATALFKDRLGNVKLSGDIQVRKIRVAIPRESFYMTLAGCVCIFFATAVIIFVPARRVEYFCDEESKAEQFISMGKNADYPDNVHNKLLVLAPGDSVQFNAVQIESLVLVPKSPTTKTAAGSGSLRYSRLSQSEPRDIQEEHSEGTSSEEVA